MNDVTRASTVLKGASVVSSLTALSRMLGFVRDLILARLFGAGMVADAFFVAFRIPNLLRSLLAEGALTSAFVPVISSELKKGEAEAQTVMSAVVTWLLIATTVLSTVIAAYAPTVVSLIAAGFTVDPDKFELCVMLTRITTFYIIFVSLISAINGTLNTVGIFGVAPFAQIVMNLVMIVAALVAGLYQNPVAVIILASGVLVGGLSQVIAQIGFIKKSFFRLRLTTKLFTRAAREVLFLLIPAVLGAAIYQVQIFASTLLASTLQEGSVSWLYYADRITQLPLGVFSIALASVLLPSLSRAQAHNDEQAFAGRLVDSLRYTSFIMLPFAAWLFVSAEDLVSFLFERGQFNSVDTLMAAGAVQALCFGLWIISCHSMIVRAFLAQKKPLIPALTSLFSLLVYLFVAVTLMGPPAAAPEGIVADLILTLRTSVIEFGITGVDMKHIGLALATVTGSGVGLIILFSVLYLTRTKINWLPFVFSTLRSLLGAMAVVLSLSYLPSSQSPAVNLGSGCLLSIVIYPLSLTILKSRELKETLALIGRVLSKKS